MSSSVFSAASKSKHHWSDASLPGVLVISLSELSIEVPSLPDALAQPPRPLLAPQRSFSSSSRGASAPAHPKPPTPSLSITALLGDGLSALGAARAQTRCVQMTADGGVALAVDADAVQFQFPLMWLSQALSEHMPSLTIHFKLGDVYCGKMFLTPKMLSMRIKTSYDGPYSEVPPAISQKLIHGAVDCAISFIPFPLFDPKLIPSSDADDSALEMAQCKTTLFVVAASELSLPSTCHRPMVQCRVVRRGRVETAWPWHVTSPAAASSATWNEAFQYELPYHVAKRSLAEVRVVDDSSNEAFASAAVPLLDLLEGAGRWCSLKMEKSLRDVTGDDCPDRYLKDAADVDDEGGGGGAHAGSIWLACGLKLLDCDATSQEGSETRSRTSTVASEARTLGTIDNMLEPTSESDARDWDSVGGLPMQEAATRGKLFLWISEAIDLPPKKNRAGLYVSVKTSATNKKAHSKPCLLAKGSTHPIWNEHLEISDVKLGETVTVQIIDARAEVASTRLLGFSDFFIESSTENSNKVAPVDETAPPLSDDDSRPDMILKIELIDHTQHDNMFTAFSLDENDGVSFAALTSKKVSQPTSAPRLPPKMKLGAMFVADEDLERSMKITLFKSKSLQRATVIEAMSFLADEPALPKPPAVADFKSSPEVAAFTKYAKSSEVFLTKREFLSFCQERFELREIAGKLMEFEIEDFQRLIAGTELDDTMQTLAANPAIIAISTCFIAEFKQTRMLDINFGSFVKFYRSTVNVTGSASGVELAAEAYALEGVGQSYAKITEVISDLDSGFKEHRKRRVRGFTTEEKDLRSIKVFMEKPSAWKEHINRIRGDVEQLSDRYNRLDDGEVGYDDVIDALVVDMSVVSKETIALEVSLRTASDYLFDKMDTITRKKNSVIDSAPHSAGATADRSTENTSYDSDDDEKYHRLYGLVLEALKLLKKVKGRGNKLSSEIEGMYEQRLRMNSEELAKTWSNAVDIEKENVTPMDLCRSLDLGSKEMNLKRPTKANPATWGAPPTTKNGRKRTVESGAKVLSTSQAKVRDSASIPYLQERRQRFEQVKCFFTSKNLPFPETEMLNIIQEVESGKSWSASFSSPIDSYALKLFSTISIFDDSSVGSAQEIVAVNGLDTCHRTQILSSFFSSAVPNFDVQRLIVGGALYSTVSRVELRNQVTLESGSVSASASQPSELDWQSAEAEAVALAIGPRGSELTPRLSSDGNEENSPFPAVGYDFDETMVVSLTQAVSGMSQAQARELVRKFASDNIETFKPELIILLSFVFAGFLKESNLSLENLVDAVAQRETNLKRKEALEKRIAEQETKETDYFRRSVYKGDEDFNLERSIEETTREPAPPSASSIPLEHMPAELSGLFAASELYPDPKDKDAKIQHLTKIMNYDYTIESAGFKLGITALHVACSRNDYDMIRLLMQRGANMHVKDYAKKKPQDYTRDLRSLTELGLLGRGNKPCELRSTLQRRVLQSVSYIVDCKKMGPTKFTRGRAVKYDFINKTFQVLIDPVDTNANPVSNVVPIYNCNMLSWTDDSSESNIQLFHDIKTRVNQVVSRLAQKEATRFTKRALLHCIGAATEFIVAWQDEAWNDISTECLIELVLEVANEDLKDAVMEAKRIADAARQRKLDEERRKEEERQRALRYRMQIEAFATKKINGIMSKTLPWMATLISSFKRFDVDGSGELSALEVISALRSLGITKKIQNSNSAILEMITRFRRFQGDMTLRQFVSNLPAEVYAAIRKYGDKNANELELKRKLLGGGDDSLAPSVAEKAQIRKALFKKETLTAKPARKRLVQKDLPPSAEEISGHVVNTILQKIVADFEEERALSSWFECDCIISFGVTGESSENIKARMWCLVGDVTVFKIVGADVLDKPKVDLEDEGAFQRFMAVLNDYQVPFKELLEEFDGFVNVDDYRSVVEACAIGVMERKKLQGRENYLEIKKKFKTALTTPLEFEHMTVELRGGRISKVFVDGIHLNDFTGRFDSFRFDSRLKGSSHSDLTTVKKVCHHYGVGNRAINILDGVVDVSNTIDQIWKLTDCVDSGGKRAGWFKKVSSKFANNGTTFRFTVTKEWEGMVTEGQVTCEGAIETAVKLLNIKSGKEFKLWAHEVPRKSGDYQRIASATNYALSPRQKGENDDDGAEDEGETGAPSGGDSAAAFKEPQIGRKDSKSNLLDSVATVSPLTLPKTNREGNLLDSAAPEPASETKESTSSPIEAATEEAVAEASTAPSPNLKPDDYYTLDEEDE